MFTGLGQRLAKVNSTFTKAIKQYEKLIEASTGEIEVSEVIIDTAKQNITTAQNVKRRASNAIVGIKQIIGE